jgi:hypothetical protein
MEELRELTAAMLQGGRITSFVYVDDKFGNMLVDKADSKIHVGHHLADISIITNPEIWEEQFEDWWRDTPEDERQKICLSWGIPIENADNLKNKFEQILPDNIERRYLSPNQFGQERDEIIENLDENHQLMILVDYKLEDYGRNGEDVLAQIAHRDYVNCAVFSGTFHMDNELAQWNSSQDKANIFKLSKERLESDDDNDILEGLRSVLWLKQISKLKEQTKNIFSEAIQFMNSHVDDIDPATFHKVILDRSGKEGCWEFETLMRIVYAYLGMGIKDKMTNDGYKEFQKLTSSLREIKRDASAHKVNYEIIKKITEEECYESAEYINKTFSQISNGDIFKIGKFTKEFILLCQPCNLEIRPNGKRKKENFDQFYIVPIRVLSDDEKPKLYEVELKMVESTQRKVAEIPNYYRVSLSLLDLVSFNADGKAVIDLRQTVDNHPSKGFIQANMMKRYGSIWKIVKEYKEKYDKIQASTWSKADKDSLSKEFCRPFEMGDSIVAKYPHKVQGNPNVLDFQVQRIKRYKDPYAKDLLSLFMEYLSRPGYPMELNVAD